jgi:phosphatidylinositol alpha-1,6-mannosyltransferase
MNNKILFISRRYPPVIGGMEEYMYRLVSEAEKSLCVYKIVLSKSQVNLLWFIPWSFFYGLYLIVFKKIRFVHAGDGVMSGVALLLKWFSPVKASATVHGLDITYNNRIYQAYIKFVLPRIDKIVCVSSATQNQCINRGISSVKLCVIPNGISTELLLQKKGRDRSLKLLQENIGLNLSNNKILVTVGRLIRRKGVLEFVQEIFPKLPKDYVYLIAGTGSQYNEIQKVITKLGLNNRVMLLGRVSDRVKFLLYESANCFVMPNIRIKGDMEGFGIVIVEAGIFGTPVVAFAVDGIVDAVIDKKTGFLVKEGDKNLFVKCILDAEYLQRETVAREVIEKYSWTEVFKRYSKFLELQ